MGLKLSDGPIEDYMADTTKVYIRPEFEDIARQYLEPLRRCDIDTLVLGCTHYPLLRDAIADFMGDGVTLVDSGYETAIYCSKILRENNLLNTDGVHQTPEFYVSDTPDGFKSVAGLFLGRNMEHTVTQIDIEQY